MDRSLDLAIGNTQISKDNDADNGDEGAKAGPIAHQHPHFCFAQFVELSNGANRRPQGRLDGRPSPDFLFFAPELFNFEFEFNRTASVTFS